MIIERSANFYNEDAPNGNIERMNELAYKVAKDYGDYFILSVRFFCKISCERSEEIKEQQRMYPLVNDSKNYVFYYFNENIRNGRGIKIPCHIWVYAI